MAAVDGPAFRGRQLARRGIGWSGALRRAGYTVGQCGAKEAWMLWEKPDVGSGNRWNLWRFKGAVTDDQP
jgi:hypothetical protein